MTRVFTLRLDEELLAKAESRAAQMGLDRAKYVRALIEEDLAKEAARDKHRGFVSEDLVGMYEGDGQVATNKAVRERLRRRSSQ